jgi:hypothetical protein
MSSLFGSKQTSSSSSSAFNGDTQPFVNQTMNAISNYRATPYTGTLSAGTNGNITNATNLFSKYANNGTLNDYASGKYIDPTTNKYSMSTYNAGLQDLMDKYNQLDDDIQSNYNKNGAYNSSMRLNSQSKNSADTKKSMADYSSDFFNNAYKTNVDTMLSAGQQQQTNANNLINAGNTEQTLSQGVLDRLYNEFIRQQDQTDNNYSNMINLVSAIKNPNASSTSTTKSGGLFGK